MHTGMASGVQVADVNPTELYQVLVAASSQDPQILYQSDKRLKAILMQFGAFDALHNIAAERSVPLPVRTLAMIQFKNEALKSWRSRKLQNDEHRKNIRARCLSFLDEEDQTIADLNQVIVSRLARQDYPSAWPGLVPQLMAVIDTNLQQRYASSNNDPRPTLLLRRSLQLLNGILREFAAYKMLTGVKTMATLVDQLHSILYGYYATMSAAFTSVDATALNSPRAYHDILLAHQVYKCIVKIAVWLWQRGDNTGISAFQAKEEWFNKFFQDSTNQVKILLTLRYSILTSTTLETPQSRMFIEILTKHVRHIGKFFRRLSQLSHPRFVQAPGCSELILFYWDHVTNAISGPSEAVADSALVLYPVRILVQGMSLFNENLAQWAPVKRDGMPNSNALSQDFVANALTIIVTRLIPLNVQDLQAWMSDPEEWVNTEEKENDQYEYEIRACSERTLMHMANQFPDYVVPLLCNMFENVAGQLAVDFQGILQKEALYCAIGRCAAKLQDKISFETWAAKVLVAEAQSTDTNYPIIKRRVAWLIGKWIQVAENPNLPIAWQILMHLLSDHSPGTDTVVRLTAAVALRESVDTLAFDINAFQQWLPMAVTELVKIMGEADTLENKRRVDYALNTVIQQAGDKISPLVETITRPLPELWSDAGEDFLLKASLLVTVTNLVNATKGDSPKMSQVVIPLVREGLQQKLQLDEDALVLWKAALRNCPDTAAVQPLLDLFPDLLRMLGNNLDLLSQVIDIIESYILLAGPQILQVCATQLFEEFHKALKVVTITAQRKDIVLTINTIVSTTPSSLWGEALHVSGLFSYLLQILFDSEIPTYVLTEHIYVFSRIAMIDRAMFLQLMTHTAPVMNLTESKLYELLMDAWWTKFDSMSEGRHRKLCAMGLASLVSTGKADVLKRLSSDIFNVWTDVFGEIREAAVAVDDEPQESPLRRLWELEDPPEEIFKHSHDSPEYERRKILYNNDPVRTIKLSNYVRGRLQEAEALYGSDAFRMQFLSDVDPTVLQQIERELAA